MAAAYNGFKTAERARRQLMGIRFFCPNGHKLNVKEHLAGKRGVCPQCGAKFSIPLPTDLQAADVAQPAGVGLSQSIEIPTSPTANQPSAIPSAAPSVIIPIAEADLAPPLPVPSPARGPEATPADALPASILAGQSPIQPDPASTSPDAAYPLQRARGRRNQVLVSLLLLALVIVLAGVLIWVLKREPSPVPADKAGKTTAVNVRGSGIAPRDLGA